MAAAILVLPMVRRTEVNVSSGHPASVTVLYRNEEPQPPLTTNGTVEKEEVKLNALMIARMHRWREHAAQERAWIHLSPTVTAWPEARRIRSLARVEQLRKGGPDEDPEQAPEVAAIRAESEAWITARCAEIVCAAKSVT